MTETESGPHVGVLLSWLAAGHLLLLALEALFPRYVFGLGPTSPWLDLAVLAGAVAIVGRRRFARTAEEVATRLSRPRYRRPLLVMTSVVVLLSLWSSQRWPAGVEVELLAGDGSRTTVGRRGDFDLDRHQHMALATHVGASVHMAGHFLPDWHLPWEPERHAVSTRWHVSGHGSLELALNPDHVVHLEEASRLTDGVIKVAAFAPRSTPIDLRFRPGGDRGDGRLRIELVGHRLAWRLFTVPVSAGAFLWISAVRVILAAWVALAVPVCLLWLALWAHHRVAMRPELTRVRRIGWEVLAVLTAVAIFLFRFAPDVGISALGDQAAFLNWADYLVHGGWFQEPPAWLARWGVQEGVPFAVLGHHVSPFSAANEGTRLVDMKPVGFPLVVALLQRLFGETAGYQAPLVMTGLGAAALYGALRVTGIGCLLSAVGALLLVFGEEVLVESTIHDPDTATLGWVASFFFAILLSSRGKRWALLSGAFFGMACLTRYNAAIALLLSIPLLFGERNRLLSFLLGGAPFLLVLLFVNWRAYGHPLHFPYQFIGRENVRLAGPYLSELGGYLRGITRDLAPTVWVPLAVYPFLRSRPRVERASVVLFVGAWVGVLGAYMKNDGHFLRYLIPAYPVIIFASVHVWQRAMELAGGLSPAVLLCFGTLSAAWVVTRMTTDEEPFPNDTTRVASAWVDHLVRPDGAILTDATLNNAIYYYTGRRHYPVTVPIPRSGADIGALRRAAILAGDLGEWVLLLPPREIDGVRREYPELSMEEIVTTAEWRLFRIAHVAGVD